MIHSRSFVSRFPVRSVALASLGVCLVFAFVPVERASAQSGREPTACMDVATVYAERLVALDDLGALVDVQGRALAALDEIARDEELDAFERRERAEALLRGRDLWDASREIRQVSRLLDNANSVVAGWRGLYCPSARPTGAAGLEGQERCDALSATFVDRIRIDNPSPVEIREREAREAERQTILKARVTRSDRDDLLELWRIRADAYDTLKGLERARSLRETAENLLARVRDAGCLDGDES